MQDYNLGMNERFIPGKVEAVAKGWKTRTKRINLFEGVIPGKTARHEAKHLVLLIENGVGAKSGTIVEGNGYLGMVEPNGWDPIAAIGPHADGDSGGSHDLSLVINRGHDPNTVGLIARSMLNRLSMKVHLVAALLETKRTVSGYEAAEVMKEADDPREVIEREDPFGNITSIIARRSQRQAIVFGMDKAA